MLWLGLGLLLQVRAAVQAPVTVEIIALLAFPAVSPEMQISKTAVSVPAVPAVVLAARAAQAVVGVRVVQE